MFHWICCIVRALQGTPGIHALSFYGLMNSKMVSEIIHVYSQLPLRRKQVAYVYMPGTASEIIVPTFST